MEMIRGKFAACRINIWRRAGTVLAGLGLLLLAGCAGHSAFDKPELVFTRIFTPQVPEFLSGPAGALLTNTPGFSARATFESYPPQLPRVETTEGELLSNGSLLLFAPRSSDAPGSKDLELGGFSFIWDVAAGSGYVMSEALQGYAPVTSSVKAKKVALAPGPRGEQSAVVTLDNGSEWLFTLSRPDSGAVPTRISSVTNSPPFILKLARTRREAPPASLFVPPPDFAKYATPERLADELAARKNNLRRRSSF
jgi:hypothetical protein